MICSTCNDTHRMPLGSAEVMCTKCPTPCRICQDGPRPYCETTPCICGCHLAGRCRFCGEDLGRQFARGSHWDCRNQLALAVQSLVRCLVDAGALCASFQLGGCYGAWTEDPHPDPAPWRPGCALENP